MWWTLSLEKGVPKLDEATCIQIINRVRTYKLNEAKIKNIAVEVCERLGVHHYEVSLQFVGPQKMRALNKEFREKDKSTDVLSFPQYEWKVPLKIKSSEALPKRRKVLNPMPLGDVVISLDDALGNAQDSGHGLDQEVCFLMVHGILHLVGHDHMKAKDKKLMFAEQDKLMKILSDKPKKFSFHKCVTPLKKREPK